MKRIIFEKFIYALILVLCVFVTFGCNENDIVEDNNQNNNIETPNEDNKQEEVEGEKDPEEDKKEPEEDENDFNKYSQDYPYIEEAIGKDYIVYTNDDENPYNIDLNNYGSDIRAIFYIPKLHLYSDPYNDITSDEFYNDYEVASSYEDAYYRTKHNLMSGDITPQEYIAKNESVIIDDIYVKCTTATYILSIQGSFIGYIPNLAEESRIIYYGCAYTSLNDVAAYLYAFGEVPANSDYHKSKERKLSVQEWGEFGRCNYDVFSGDTSKYPYEPLLPTVRTATFRETDFGTLGGYETYNSVTGTHYIQGVYNNGIQISRGAARLVFTDISSVKNIDNRYVFYTYNHYNDFEEYLNYDNGWGKRFGNTSAGNEYCGSSKDYYASNKYPITQYEQTILKKLDELIN